MPYYDFSEKGRFGLGALFSCRRWSRAYQQKPTGTKKLLYVSLLHLQRWTAMDDDVIDVSDRTEFIRRMRSARKDYDNPCIYCTRICIETKCDKYNEWVDSMRKRQSSRQNAPQHA